jgi:hypothetical protein
MGDDDDDDDDDNNNNNKALDLKTYSFKAQVVLGLFISV